MWFITKIVQSGFCGEDMFLNAFLLIDNDTNMKRTSLGFKMLKGLRVFEHFASMSTLDGVSRICCK